jgi:hypothetical protein
LLEDTQQVGDSAGIEKQSAATKKGGGVSAAQRTAGLVATVVYFVYPGFSASIFQAFNCITVDGTKYLRVDLAVSCDSEEHAQQIGWAEWGVGFCCIGAPALYAFLLYRDTRFGSGESYLSFMKQDYQPRYWYWEPIDMLKKLLLTGVAAFWFPGTLMQIIMSMFVVFVAFTALCLFRPFCGQDQEEEEDNAKTAVQKAVDKLTSESILNTFAMFQAASTFFTLFGALLVKINASYESTGLYEEGYNYQTLEYGLVGVAVAILVVGLWLILVDLHIIPWKKFCTKTQEEWVGSDFLGCLVGKYCRSRTHNESAKLTALLRQMQYALDDMELARGSEKRKTAADKALDFNREIESIIIKHKQAASATPGVTHNPILQHQHPRAVNITL